MAKQVVGVGNVANDNTGDFLRPAMIKVNENFTELYDFNDTFAAVAFTGNYDDLNNVPAGASFDGTYDSLTGKPVLGTASAENVEAFALTARGLPTGGGIGEVLMKAGASDYDVEWGEGGGSLTEVVEDTSPQLGGNLDLNSFTITGMVIGTDIQAYSSVLANTTASFLIADETKLDALPTNAALNLLLDDKADTVDTVLKTDYNAQTVLVAVSDNTPTALTVGEATLVGRQTGGDIEAVSMEDVLSMLGGFFPTDGLLVVEDGVITVEDGSPISFATLDEQLNGGSTNLITTVNAGRFMYDEVNVDYAATITLMWDGLRIVDGDLTDSDTLQTLIDDVSGAIDIQFDDIHPGLVGEQWRIRLVNNGSGTRAVSMTTANGVTVDLTGQTIPVIASGAGMSVELQGTIVSTAHVRLDRILTGNLTTSAPTGAGTGDVTLTGVQELTNKTLTAPIINAATIGTSLVPTTNDGAALGDTTHQFSDLFLAEGAVINFDNSDVTITQTSNDLTVAGISTFSLGTSTVATMGSIELGHATANTITASSGILSVEGVAQVNLSANQVLTNKTLTSPVLTTATVTTSLVPTSDDGAALGSTSNKFSDLFLAEGGVINWDSSDVTITQTANDLTVAGISTFGVGTSTAVTLGTIELGHASANTLSAASGVLSIEGIPVGPNVVTNSLSAAKTFVASETNQAWYHPSADTSARTWTIDSNTNVPLPTGTFLTFINDTSGGVITIAITSDTLVWSPAGTTGSRQLAANGIATAVKMTSTRWMISGSGLT